jgi:hypothetical protein
MISLFFSRARFPERIAAILVAASMNPFYYLAA